MQILTCLVLLLVLCLLSKLSPVEFTEEGERSESRKFVEPDMRVIEKPCDLILKHMAVCFVSPSLSLSLGCVEGGGGVGGGSGGNGTMLMRPLAWSMSHLFLLGFDLDQTPSFILIPSGTKIAGKEVGLLIVSLLALSRTVVGRSSSVLGAVGASHPRLQI